MKLMVVTKNAEVNNQSKRSIPTDFSGQDDTTTNFTILWPSNHKGNFIPS